VYLFPHLYDDFKRVFRLSDQADGALFFGRAFF